MRASKKFSGEQKIDLLSFAGTADPGIDNPDDLNIPLDVSISNEWIFLYDAMEKNNVTITKINTYVMVLHFLNMYAGTLLSECTELMDKMFEGLNKPQNDYYFNLWIKSYNSLENVKVKSRKMSEYWEIEYET